MALFLATNVLYPAPPVVPTITFDLLLFDEIHPYNERMYIAANVGGNGESDVKETIMKFASAGDVSICISPFLIETNTGNNDGYFDISVDGVSKYRKYLTSNVNTALTDMPIINLLSGETVTINIGFDNYHSGCHFLYTRYNPNS